MSDVQQIISALQLVEEIASEIESLLEKVDVTNMDLETLHKISGQVEEAVDVQDNTFMTLQGLSYNISDRAEELEQEEEE